MSARRRILLINPNSSAATTAMMVRIAGGCLPDGFVVTGATATVAPAMIVDAAALDAAAAEVLELAQAGQDQHDGFIVAAFGDPGATAIRANCRLPVVGIGAAAIVTAARLAPRFGIATTTPALEQRMAELVTSLGLTRSYTGARFTTGDLPSLMADPARLRAALAAAARRCVDEDGAGAVIIGGGPLGQAAHELQEQLEIPIIAPIPAAVAELVALLKA